MTWLLNPFRFASGEPSAFADAFDLWWAKDLDGGDIVNAGTNPDAATHTLDPVGSPTHTDAGILSSFALNGSSQYFTATNTGNPGLTYTVLTIFVTDALDGGTVWAKQGDGTSGSADLRITSTTGVSAFRVFGTSTTGDAFSTATRHVVSVRRDGVGNDEFIRVDGSDTNTGTGHNAMDENAGWYVGARWVGSATSYLTGDLFLHAYWKRQLSGSELTEIEDYFA